ncbi:MAG: acyltransferase [Petrimonas sp.]|nr:acyltransferase [Petrimonas sp.]
MINNVASLQGQSSNGNIAYITLTQAVGCFLVIYGHSYPFVTSIPSYFIELRSFLYCFHMPLFIWCSGFLFTYTNQAQKYTFGEFSLHRAKKLLLPYVLFSIVGLIPKYLLEGYINDTVALDAVSILRVFVVPRENVWGHLWFLPMIYIMGLLGNLVEKLAKEYKLIAWGSLAFLFLFAPSLRGGWFAINDAINYFTFYAFGAVCALFWKRIRESSECTNRNNILTKGWACLVIAVILYLILGSNDVYGVVLVKRTIGILMIFFVLSISKYICDQNYSIERDSLVAQTYQIFLLSWPCQAAINVLFERVAKLSFWVVHVSMFLAGVLLPITIIAILRKTMSNDPGKQRKISSKVVSTFLGY